MFGYIVLYVLIVGLANLVGVISGMGGGVIIKPLMDSLQVHSMATIDFFSTVAVFTTSIVSTGRQLKTGALAFSRRLLFIAVGAGIGGIAGKMWLSYLVGSLGEQSASGIQIATTIVLLFVSIVYTFRFKHVSLHLSRNHWYFFASLSLGLLSSFMGIGGGPMNVALFLFAFGVDIKVSTMYSIVTIFSSQLLKLATIGADVFAARTVVLEDTGIVWFIIPAAIVGGIIGTRLSQYLSDAQVEIIYLLICVVVLVINMMNLWHLIG
ncbi:sulfite exporter TauE/SafE family protein [Vagococcus acidifermentans]|uniref:Probable membrane transporter protein n=1 Tax=Vagococcus acidifermentans TaxID=564710 RepID=A0A430AUJ8_9ENTE|nr:sulfite exporter TauE/SafE family protein [Vagococcus acidifermentans]RSU11732.1 hypothetical protein CBF27_07150 [Vagococcus acidifermentans]